MSKYAALTFGTSVLALESASSGWRHPKPGKNSRVTPQVLNAKVYENLKSTHRITKLRSGEWCEEQRTPKARHRRLERRLSQQPEHDRTHWPSSQDRSACNARNRKDATDFRLTTGSTRHTADSEPCEQPSEITEGNIENSLELAFYKHTYHLIFN